MEPITAISGVLGCIKTATDIAKTIKDADLTLEKAEMKLKLADMILALADAKINLVGLQETIEERDKHIADLENALRQKEDVVKVGDSYYQKGEDGNGKGYPYCSHCYEVKHKLVHVTQVPTQRMSGMCPACKHVVRYYVISR